MNYYFINYRSNVTDDTLYSVTYMYIGFTFSPQFPALCRYKFGDWLTKHLTFHGLVFYGLKSPILQNVRLGGRACIYYNTLLD